MAEKSFNEINDLKKQVNDLKLELERWKNQWIYHFDVWHALRYMLKILGREDCYDMIKHDIMKNGSYSQNGKSEYQFTFNGRLIALDAHIFIIDVNVTRRNAFMNSLRRRFKRFREGMFEIINVSTCTIAYD